MPFISICWPLHYSKGRIPKSVVIKRHWSSMLLNVFSFVQSAGTVEYTDCISAEGQDTSNEFPVYDTKQSDGEVPVMLKLWGMPNTPSLPLLPGPLWLEVVAPDRVLSISQIEPKCELMLNWIVWNRTVLTFNCAWTKSTFILNLIVWSRTVFILIKLCT